MINTGLYFLGVKKGQKKLKLQIIINQEVINDAS